MNNYKIPQNYLKWESFIKKFQDLETLYNHSTKLNYNNPLLDGVYYMHDDFLKESYPIYCIRNETLELIEKTDIGENIPLLFSIEMTLPCFMIMFPKGFFKFRDNNLNYVIVTISESDETDVFKHQISWCGIDSKFNLLFSQKNIRKDGTFLKSFISEDFKSDSEQGFRLRNIVLQSILILQYQQNEIVDMSDEDLNLKIVKGFKSKSQVSNTNYIYPRWLGVKRTRSAEVHNVNKNTQKGKREHWRRGFWRSQPCGVKNQERKITWVKPCLINPEL